MSLKYNLQNVLQKIDMAANKSGRKAKDIKLVAVSKTWPTDKISQLYNDGQKSFGENYVNEFLEKSPELPPDIDWHYVGRLQSNKVKDVLQKFSLIHAVDSLSVIKEFEKRLADCDKKIKQNILMQVQYLPEKSKSGISLGEVHQFISEIQSYDRICLKGVMWMPPLDLESRKNIYKAFVSEVDTWKREISAPHSLDLISLGTTHDFEDAIEAGANIVRVGSAIFGERQ